MRFNGSNYDVGRLFRLFKLLDILDSGSFCFRSNIELFDQFGIDFCVQDEREGPHLFFYIQIASLAHNVKVFPPNVYFWHFYQKSGGCT